MGILLIFGVVLEILLMLVITCIQTFLYYKTIGLRSEWRGRRLAALILVSSILSAMTQLISPDFADLPVVDNLIVVIFMLYPILFMGGRLKERIFYGILNFAIFLFAIRLTAVIVFPQQMYLSIEELLEPVTLAIFIFIIFLYAVLVLIITHLSNEGKHYMPRKYWTGMILCFSAVCVSLVGGGSFNAGIEEEIFVVYLTIFILALLVIWLLVYFIFYFACRYFSKAAEINTLAVQNDMVERYMLRKQESDERIKILSHDLKHSLAQWRMLAEEKQDEGALLSISEYEEQLQFTLLIDVENESANAIINQKCWEAGQEQVKFLVYGTFHEDLRMSRLDLCSLLGNLLDNAIEAAAQTEMEQQRCVKLSIRRKGNLLILVVENGYVMAPVVENGVFITRKKDKELHAIGMRSIRYIAEKYDGAVRNSYENNWFKASVMLRGYTSILSDEN